MRDELRDAMYRAYRARLAAAEHEPWCPKRNDGALCRCGLEDAREAMGLERDPEAKEEK